MTALTDEIAALTLLEPAGWAAYLEQRSGLPGPRANLTLVQAAAEVAGSDIIESLLQHGGEYQAMCAAAAAGRRAADHSFEALARSVAADDRWRVREGVAIGLQLLGDRDLAALVLIVSDWVDDPDPLVERAALAAICEPRLLRTPAVASAALAACRRATLHMLEWSPVARREPAARTLRQALGYCWSVAVAADPEAGVPAFLSLDSTDPDVAWIIRENRRKKRSSALL